MTKPKWLAFRNLHGRHRETPGSNILSHIALLLLCLAVVVLCTINDKPFQGSPQMQTIAQALFIIASACMYIVYMTITMALHLVLSCVEHRYHGVAGYEEEEELMVITEIKEGGVEEAVDADTWKACDDPEQIERVPTEVVVSSMYMGGVGSFLAVSPLCMWYPPSTMAFCIALIMIAVHTEKKIIAIVACVGFTIGFGAWFEFAKPIAMESWCHIIVGAASPFFLWMSAGNGGSLYYHRLSAGKTLETALPVSVVLSILVLCWYVLLLLL